jgi:hypothetical protein
MDISVIHSKSGIDKSEHKLFNKFIEFLQKNYPLEKNIKVNFLGNRIKDMTTGERTDEHELFILSAGRLNRDIIRTLAHEWIHEYQHAIKHKKKGKNIGGHLENEANALSGELVKKFERYHPDFTDLIYKTHEKLS